MRRGRLTVSCFPVSPLPPFFRPDPVKLFTFGYLYYWSGTVLNVPRMQQAIIV